MSKVLVLHTGARDHYEVAYGLYEADMLSSLVTNGYDHSDNSSNILYNFSFVKNKIKSRKKAEIPDSLIKSYLTPELVVNCAKLFSEMAYNHAYAWQEKFLALEAAKIALKSKCDAVLSYNYCAYHVFDALKETKIKKILFQCHPHPQAAINVFLDEITLNPKSELSLKKEKELSWGNTYLKKLVSEPLLADGIIAASTFTKNTLIDNEIDASKIFIVPYGADTSKLHKQGSLYNYNKSKEFVILFVGQMVERKGIKYLIEACKKVDMNNAILKICGRGLAEYSREYNDLKWVKFIYNATDEDLAKLYQTSDVFVLPSLLEGFGLVILEAMSFGKPVITTSNTGGLDVIEEGIDGYIVPIRDTDSLAERIERLKLNPDLLAKMGEAAINKASKFTWKKFRKDLTDAVSNILCE